MTASARTGSEADLAAAAVQYFRDLGWETYEEVSFGGGGARPDLVAVHHEPTIVHVVEAKRTMGFSVLEQAYRWLAYANLVTVLTPCGRRGGAPMARRVCESYGIGWARPTGEAGLSFEPRPAFHRRAPRRDALLRRLAPEQRDGSFPAGSAGGGYHTPFRQTCKAVRAIVTEVAGISTKELVARLDHHYASDATARYSLVKWGRLGVIQGVKLIKEGRKMAWYPTDGKP